MRLRALVLATLVLVSACAGGTAAQTDSAEAPALSAATGSDEQPAAPEATADADVVATEDDVAVGPQAPADAEVPDLLQFDAQTVSGDPVSGGEFAGQDLMVWFWAPW